MGRGSQGVPCRPPTTPSRDTNSALPVTDRHPAQSGGSTTASCAEAPNTTGSPPWCQRGISKVLNIFLEWLPCHRDPTFYGAKYGSSSKLLHRTTRKQAEPEYSTSLLLRVYEKSKLAARHSPSIGWNPFALEAICQGKTNANRLVD